MRFRDHVADLVEGAADEIHELEFGDGAHAGERRYEGRAHDGGLGDGRVDDALGAEAVDETVRDFERAAVNADVFAEAEDGGVAVHFFPDSLADGFEVGQLHRLLNSLATPGGADHARAHFPPAATMAGDHNISVDDRPTHHAADLVHDWQSAHSYRRP